MKKYLIFPLIVLLLFVAQACSEDDSTAIPEPEPTTEELLLGKWHFESFEDSFEGTSGEFDECTKKGYWHFMQDGKIHVEEFEPDGSNGCVSFGVYTRPYSLSVNDEIVLTDPKDGEIYSIAIDSISTKILVLEYSDGYILEFAKPD